MKTGFRYFLIAVGRPSNRLISMPFEYACTQYIFRKHIRAKFVRERLARVFFRVLDVGRPIPLARRPMFAIGASTQRQR